MASLTRPVIGITSSIVMHNTIPSVHVHEKYICSVRLAGGIPLVIPIATKDMAEDYISLCDGIILSSGEDVDPYSYQALPLPQLQKTNGKRDKMEIELINHAKQQQKPILAICRGITMLNATLGGTLIQDIPTANPKAINHYQQAERSQATHDIQIDENSRLYRILNRSNIRVNSMHHQAIDILSPLLKKVAVAPDGVIEAVEGTNESPLILGVQWHPEEMAGEDIAMSSLFKYFTDECNFRKK